MKCALRLGALDLIKPLKWWTDWWENKCCKIITTGKNGDMQVKHCPSTPNMTLPGDPHSASCAQCGNTGKPWRASFIHVPLGAARGTRRKKRRTALTREVIFHRGTSSPAFQRKEAPSLPQQGCTNHHLQPMGNCHNLQLLFSNKPRFKPSSPVSS